MNRAYYSEKIEIFLLQNPDEVLGILTKNSDFSVDPSQRDAWMEQISVLKTSLAGSSGTIYLEYSIPRMGKRIDALLVIGSIVLVLEFKVGEKEFTGHAFDQVYDYAVDLKNFHESSHDKVIAPIVIATEAQDVTVIVATAPQDDGVLLPIRSNAQTLKAVIDGVIDFVDAPAIDQIAWEKGRYSPTPTIIEAARALFNGHTVSEISRSDAGATNLTLTSEIVSRIIVDSKEKKQKSICFVTGVPGAGKTLVGLNIANMHSDESNELYSVFLSGNGPLVHVLREALIRDKVQREKEQGRKMKKGAAAGAVKTRIQNVHHFRDDCLVDSLPPKEHVALFDEAQRAWDLTQTSSFMRRKKNQPNFNQSEPEFLISCLDRHQDWAVVVCLVGGGQEIHTGEAGISEWVASLKRRFPDWHLYISPKLHDTEYGAGAVLMEVKDLKNVTFDQGLHLSTSMRSFRAEEVSLLVKQMLDLKSEDASATLERIGEKYPMVITRNLATAKKWLRDRARGTERYGIVVSSHAERLKPEAIDIRSPMDPVHWFLDHKEDVRSSYYLEDVATEFHVQGLELDWACVTWDADFRIVDNVWQHKAFLGSKWQNILKEERKRYQKNAYRVLLTRARQGMVIVIPAGDVNDPTRHPSFYDPTFEYLKGIGFEVI